MKFVNELSKSQKKRLYRITAAAVLEIALAFIPLGNQPVLRFVLYLIPYLIAGYDILIEAFEGIRNHQVFDECFLMAVATLGAMALGDYAEAVAVMVFYQIGELFQDVAVGKSRRSISELMDIRPDYANLEQDGDVTRVDPDEVEVGSVIVVRPGEKVPIDGLIVEGTSSVNTSALTGESLPRDVKEGDELLSGTVNMSGVLRVQTTKEFEESTASKILDLVESASDHKARSEQFITKFARVYTPAVCYSALALAILGPAISILAGVADPSMETVSRWVYRALTFLVISCPCAIVVSIPLSFFGGLGAASRQGVLIKGSNFMETLADVKVVVLDKTGTITKGNFEVTDVHENQRPKEELLELAALAEGHSTHPIALSIRRAWQKSVSGAAADAAGGDAGEQSDAAAPAPDLQRVTRVEEISGKGVVARIDDKEDVALGNLRLMEHLGIDCKPCESIGTIIYIAVDGHYEGHFVIADEIKPEAKEAIEDLKKVGVKKTVMLTGDVQSVADAVAEEVGVTEVCAGLLPADKVTKVEELLKTDGSEAGGHSSLAFVGDGINDAPVLTRADLGIAMGALGSDAAIEAADVVLMDDDPRSIAKAIRIARKCIRIVYENIIFAIGVKFLCLILGAVGIANMWLAIFADVGVMVICVLNAVRMLK